LFGTKYWCPSRPVEAALKAGGICGVRTFQTSSIGVARPFAAKNCIR
jgi:hypothetical protein